MLYTIESRRIAVVMKNEEVAANIEIDEKDAVWDMSVFQYGCNVMAAIAGAAATTKGNQPVSSTGKSVLGGALSGAAAGMMTGNPVFAGIGAVIGGLGGLLG